MILLKRAREVAASVAVKLVATPKSTIVFENLRISSFLIPNCPAASATCAILTALAGISLDI